jgi:hypothetical protein
MRCVVLETISASSDIEQLYRKACRDDSLARGESSFFAETAGSTWHTRADAIVVYYDLGLPDTAFENVRAAVSRGQTVLLRSLPAWSNESRDRRPAHDRLSELLRDPAAARLAEQSLELDRASALFSDLAASLRFGKTSRENLASICERAAQALAPGLTPADTSALFDAIRRSL